MSNKSGIELYSNDIIEAFLWDNRKAIELIKIGKRYEVYSIKDKHIMLYVTIDKNEKRCFNTQICINLSRKNKLNIDTIEKIHNCYVFM